MGDVDERVGDATEHYDNAIRRLHDPTPKLTARAIAERQRLARICEDGRDAEIRRKAFEQAADKAPALVKLMENEGLFHGPYASGYKTADEAASVAVAVLDAALRALAKEQSSTET